MKKSRLLNSVKYLVIALCCCWLGLRLVPLPSLLDKSLSSIALYDSQGKLLNMSLSKDEKYRLYTPLTEISPAIKKATLLYEDRHFYSHPGVNPLSLVRAALMTLTTPSKPIGGSTMTMQLVRLRFVLSTRSLIGKLTQIFLALAIERQYSKEQILEAYLNLAPYGANVEGVGAASLIYFRKKARELTADESVSLAVIPQHPSLRWRRAGQKDLDQARLRLASMWQKAYGEQVEPREFTFTVFDTPHEAPHFFYRARSLKPDLTEINSTIQADLQKESELVLQDNLRRFHDFGIENGTLMIAELPEMKVRAYVGSANYLRSDISGFVNGLTAQRSPGSILKPFVYGLGLDQGKIIPESLLSDVPIRLAAYNPENFERNFLGPISATEALVRSRNIPALELFRKLEPTSLYRLLKNAGIDNLLPEEHYGIALVLGGLGVSSEEAVQLYGILGNAGILRNLNFFSDQKPVADVQILSAEASYLIKDMLAKNPPALGRFRELKIPWKTGTSNGSKDAWAAGIVGKYVLVAWLGNFDGKPNPNLIGRDFAGPVFFSMVDRLLSEGLIVAPASSSGMNIKKIEVCALTGALPNETCPHRKTSWFIPGVSPILPCSVHRNIAINPTSGLRTCPGSHGEKKVYEVWGSDMQQLFLAAGLKRNLPPPYDIACALPDLAPQKIRIISPEEHIEYYLEKHRELEIELLTSAPGDTSLITWFIDQKPVTQIEPTKSFYWKAKVGLFEVRAVDDLGRSSKVNIKVIPRTG